MLALFGGTKYYKNKTRKKKKEKLFVLIRQFTAQMTLYCFITIKI